MSHNEREAKIMSVLTRTACLLMVCALTEACGEPDSQESTAVGGQGGEAATDGAARSDGAAVDGHTHVEDAADSSRDTAHVAVDAAGAADAANAADTQFDSADGHPATDAAHTPGMLDTSVVSQIVEPEGSGHDDKGTYYNDQSYWNFCSPGAVTVALYFIKPDNVVGWPAGYFKEPAYAGSCNFPSNGTYWESDESASGYHTFGRAYLMHLALEVDPPSYAEPGLVAFSSCKCTGSFLVDDRDALNWEGSEHATNWKDFHYKIQSMSGFTAAKLHSDVKQDIDQGFAVVAAVDTGYLANWKGVSLSHAITIVGYDDAAATYSYTDTCGTRCNKSGHGKNGGVWTIAQDVMVQAIKGDDSGYVW